MATTRTYDDGCAAAHALDLVGERWALLVVRELLLGPKRFTDLRSGLPHASPNVLAQRLRDLEAAGVRTAVLRYEDFIADAPAYFADMLETLDIEPATGEIREKETDRCRSTSRDSVTRQPPGRSS